MRENEKIRRAARVADVPLYRIARELGVSEPTMTRWLRFPLPEDKEAKILGAIERLSQEVNTQCG